MTTQEPKWKGATVGPGLDNALVPRAENKATQGESSQGFGEWFTASDMNLLGGFIARTSGSQPDPEIQSVGESIERLVMSYPMVSKDLVVGMAVSGQLDADSALLDEIEQRDLLAQKASNDNRGWTNFKTGIRGSAVILEDLYNNAWFQVLPRIAINMNQGDSFTTALDQAQGSAIQNQIMLNKLGFDVDYGQGFFPSEDLIPQSPEFWALIKQQLMDGTFEGSVEEQIIAAKQAGMIDQAYSVGINPYAMGRSEWQSTKVYGQFQGETYSAPYSPGAGVMINFSVPGQRLFEYGSAIIDGTFRITMEPGDYILDNIGDVLRAGLNPLVTGDYMTFTSRGSATMREIAEDSGIAYLDDPVMTYTGKYDELTGEEIATPAKGIADPITGEAAIDPDVIERQWLGRIDDTVLVDNVPGKRTKREWSNPEDPYVKPHVDAGRTPDDVREILAQKGGLEAEAALTIEHELVHVKVQGEYYTPLELDDGTKIITNEGVNASAPEELRRIGQEAIDEGVTHQEMLNAENALADLTNQIDELVNRQQEILKKVNTKTTNPDDVVKGRKALKKLDDEIRTLKKRRGTDQAVMTRKAKKKIELDEARRAFTESEAVSTAWKNMISGKWTGKKFIKKFKRQHGISNLWRPHAAPKQVSQYIQTRPGRRTLRRLARTDRIQDIRKFSGWASDSDLLKLQKAKTEGAVAEILQESLNKNPTISQPSIGVFQDLRIGGMDSWQATHKFLGGDIAGAMRRQGRKWGASTGSNTLSLTDSAERLNTIQNVLNTATVDPDKISDLMAYSIKKGNRVEGLNNIERRMEELITERLLELKERGLLGFKTGDFLYEADDVDKMFFEWRKLQNENRIYHASNKGKERPILWEDGAKETGNLDASQIKGQAVMEAQFAVSSRVVPDVRRVRRLTSPHRTAMETYKKARTARLNADKAALGIIPLDKVWDPLGFEFSNAAKAGDFSFGIWRDMQLLRGGWAFRVIPEESIRFMGAGYAQLFNNPLDYLISAFNKIDYKLDGSDLTIADMLKHNDALGAAKLRDTVAPLHRVKGTGWKMVSRLDEGTKREYWGGITRHIISMAHDEVSQLVAKVGLDEAFVILSDTEDGKAILKRISQNAKQGGPLELIVNADELNYYLDVTNLRLAQIKGGKGIWKNPVTKQWEDLNDVPFLPVTDRRAVAQGGFPNKQALRDELATQYPDAPKPLSKATRLDLENALNDARGFDLDELNELGIAALVTDEGSDAIGELIANRKLGNIDINEELPYDQIRQLDSQWEGLYEELGVELPESIPAAASELENMKPGTYKATTDKLFYWLNSIPSTKLNRQPFFQQSFGNKLAQVYYFGDSEMRAVIDELVTTNRSMGNAFRIGKRKLYKDFAISKMPKSFDKWERGGGTLPQPDPSQSYADAYGAGMYDEIPLEGGGYLTPQWNELMDELGNVEAKPGIDEGMYAYRHGDHYKHGKLRSSDLTVFHGSQTMKPTARSTQDAFDYASQSGEIRALRETEAKYIKDGVEVPDALRAEIDGAQAILDDMSSSSPSQARADKLDARRTTLQDQMDEASANHEIDWEEQIQNELEEIESELEDLASQLSDEMQANPTGEYINTPLTSGGQALDITRANEYAMMRRGRNPSGEKWASVFYRPHMPKHLQDHYDSIGDVEQIYSIADKYPDLKNIPDLPERWNGLIDDIETGSDELLNKMMVDREPLVQEMNDLGYEIAMDTDIGMPGWVQITEKNLLGKYVPVRSSGLSATGAMSLVYENHPELQDIYKTKFMFDSYLITGQIGDPTDIMVLKQYVYPKLSKDIGRELTRVEMETLSSIMLRRKIRKETQLVTNALTPIAQLPMDVLMSMMDNGWVATTPRGVGDTALALEKYTDSFTPTVSTTSLGIAPSEVTQRVLDEIEDMFNMVDTPGNTTQRIFTNDFSRINQINDEVTSAQKGMYNSIVSSTGEVGIIPDYGLYVTSAEYRGFIDETIEWEDSLRARLAPYLDIGGSPLPDELWDELEQYAQTLEVVEKGGKAFDMPTVQNMKLVSGDYAEAHNPMTKLRAKGFDYQAEEADLWQYYGEEAGDFYADGTRVTGLYQGQIDLDQFLGEAGKGPAAKLKENVLFGLEDTTYLDEIYVPEPSLPGGRKFKEGVLEGKEELKFDFDAVPQEERNASVSRVFPGDQYGMNFDIPELGSLSAENRKGAGLSSGVSPQRDAAKELDEILKTAKYDAIEETKALFYDLSQKSNIADALKFVFPFGDAWYEVLSRWATIMNPVKQGGQALRNVRRIQVFGQAAKQSGFISTNEFGDEVFNWPIAPGSAMNFLIPNDSNVSMTAKVAVSGMTFIDPSARGGLMPGVNPVIQLANMLIAPATEQIPVFGDMQRWFVYGSKDAFEPGNPDELSDVLGLFAPTVLRRLVSAVFDVGATGTVGTTKMRLLESLMISGDAGYNPLDPRGAQRAWDVANTAGTWLSWLRVLDSWFLPAQPQYAAEFNQPGQQQQTPGYEDSMKSLFTETDPEDQRMGYQEVLAEAAKLSYEQQQPLISILSLVNEYRLAREIFGDAEANMYMIERHGVLPALLQSSSEALTEVPVTWGDVEWSDDNPWFNDIAPLTFIWGIPEDVDDTFSTAAWNNQFSDLFELEGIENTVIRRRRSASEIHEFAMRSVGYEQLRYQKALYESAVEKQRIKYGDSYAQNSSYRVAKRAIDQVYMSNKQIIYTEYPTIKPGNDGKIIGSTQGVTTQRRVDEMIEIGSPGTAKNLTFNENLPELAAVAEFYAKELIDLRAFSLQQADSTAGAQWWRKSTTDTSEAVRKEFRRRSAAFYGSLTGPARDYANNINERLLSPLIQDWSWSNKAWSQELEIFPSVTGSDTVVTP